MNAKTPDHLIEKCRELRIIERLPVRHIASRLNIGMSTVFHAVKDIKLTDAEIKSYRQQAAKKARASRTINPHLVDGKWADVIRRSKLTTDQRGAIAEAATILRLKIYGFTPHLSLCAGSKTDILVSTGNKTHRIQVKCASRPKHGGMPVANFSTRRGKEIVRYSDNDFDFFVGYDLIADICYVFSMKEIPKTRCITMTAETVERWDKLVG